MQGKGRICVGVTRDLASEFREAAVGRRALSGAYGLHFAWRQLAVPVCPCTDSTELRLTPSGKGETFSLQMALSLTAAASLLRILRNT